MRKIEELNNVENFKFVDMIYCILYVVYVKLNLDVIMILSFKLMKEI